MEFTGERYVPGSTPPGELYVEHMSRYLYASGLAKDRCVLDVGCGCGYGSHWLALMGARMVIGVDISEDAIEFASKNYHHPSLHFAIMDAYHLAFGRIFELVTCFEVFEHVKNPVNLLSEIKRVTEDHGIVMISTPNRLTYRAGGPEGKNPFHFKEYDESEFKTILMEFFTHVVMMGQFWVEGTLIGDLKADNGQVLKASILPEESFSKVTASDDGTSYLFAICSQSPIEPRLLQELNALFIDRHNWRHRDLKSMLQELSQELDQRARWAKRLDNEVRQRDETISRLREELQDLRRQFDERGQWALSLDRRVKELEAEIARISYRLSNSGLDFLRSKEE